jgi:hypothetical protein
MKPETMDLQATLRTGDPARGEALEPVAAARLRAALETALAESAAPSPWPWRAIWAGLALTGVALVIGLRAPQAPAPGPSAAAPRPAVEINVKNQQLQFETPDGVRIVWVLSPNVHL